MAQIINDTTLAGRLGESLGTGLNQLAQNKLSHVMSQHDLLKQQQLNRANEQHERSRYAAGLAPLLGQTTANFLSNLGPKEREHAFQNISALMQLNQPPQQQQQQRGISAVTPENQPQPQQNTVENQPSDRSKLIQDVFTSPHEKREGEKLDIKKQEFERNRSKDVREYLKPHVERISKIKANRRDYKQLISLAEGGDVRSGNVHQLLTKLNLQDFGRNAPTEIAGKLIARLAQNVSGVFGQNSRITNFLEQTFQRSLPDLKNTPEGIIAISILNIAAEEGEEIKHDIRKQIIKENGGKLPDDIDDQVEERAQPLIDKLDSDAFERAQAATAPITNKKNKKSAEQFQSLPPASEYNGRKIRDSNTGQILQSNGSQWIPVR